MSAYIRLKTQTSKSKVLKRGKPMLKESIIYINHQISNSTVHRNRNQIFKKIFLHEIVFYYIRMMKYLILRVYLRQTNYIVYLDQIRKVQSLQGMISFSVFLAPKIISIRILFQKQMTIKIQATKNKIYRFQVKKKTNSRIQKFRQIKLNQTNFLIFTPKKLNPRNIKNQKDID